MLPELGQGQQRAITYLWAATQVAATVVRDAFVEIYSSLPDSGGGHTSIRKYCSQAGRSGVYLELLDEGYLSSHLAGSPRDAAFLDLKVTRKMLEKVLAEKFDRGKYGRLVFEVRQLVYLRNDLCHQLLPALPPDQYLELMQQLETRLCTVTRQAALLAGAANPPEAALHHIRALFTSLLNTDDDLAHRTDRRSRTDSGTQADLHLATLEKGVQADTIPRHDPGPAAPTKEKIDSLQRQTKEETSGNINYEQELGKILADSPDPGTPRGGAVTGGIDAAGGGRQGRQGCYYDAGCRLTRNSKNSLLRHCDGTTPVKENKTLLNCQNTETNTTPAPCLFPGHSLLCGDGIMRRKAPSNYAANQGFATLPCTAMTVNHVAYASHKGPCVSSILDVGLSLLLTVMLFLGVFSVTTLPSALTILRLAVNGLYYLLVQANRACRQLIGNLCSGKGPREVVCMTEVVLIPSVAPEKVCGPAMVRPRDENVMNFWKSDRKVACRRKKRKKTTRMIN